MGTWKGKEVQITEISGEIFITGMCTNGLVAEANQDSREDWSIVQSKRNTKEKASLYIHRVREIVPSFNMIREVGKPKRKVWSLEVHIKEIWDDGLGLSVDLKNPIVI